MENTLDDKKTRKRRKKPFRLTKKYESPVLNPQEGSPFGGMSKEERLEAIRKRLADTKYPLKYSSVIGGITKYDPELMPVVAFDILTDGKTVHALLIEFGISMNELKTWCAKFPEFCKAVELGMSYSYHWWLEQGRMNIGNPDFNTKLYEMQMKNRFGWLTKAVSNETVIDNINVINNISGGSDSDAPVLDLDKLNTKDLDTLRKLMKKSGKPDIIDVKAE